MKQIIALLLPTLLLAGCVASNQVTRMGQYAEINAQGRERRATITLQVESMTVEYDGDYVTVGRDSVQWLDPETHLGRIAATANLRRIRFTNHGIGAVEGTAFGVLPGGTFLALTYLDNEGGDASGVRAGLRALGLGAALGGMVIGAASGALIGHKTDYQF
jgi:hypothetical protein